MIHPILIILLKIVYDIVPSISQETSWTLTNITYMFGSYLMFHWVRGVPFEFNAGAYDNLNMWEQLDGGQYVRMSLDGRMLTQHQTIHTSTKVLAGSTDLPFPRQHTLHTLRPYILHDQPSSDSGCGRTKASGGECFVWTLCLLHANDSSCIVCDLRSSPHHRRSMFTTQMDMKDFEDDHLG